MPKTIDQAEQNSQQPPAELPPIEAEPMESAADSLEAENEAKLAEQHLRPPRTFYGHTLAEYSAGHEGALNQMFVALEDSLERKAKAAQAKAAAARQTAPQFDTTLSWGTRKFMTIYALTLPWAEVRALMYRSQDLHDRAIEFFSNLPAQAAGDAAELWAEIMQDKQRAKAEPIPDKIEGQEQTEGKAPTLAG